MFDSMFTHIMDKSAEPTNITLVIMLGEEKVYSN